IDGSSGQPGTLSTGGEQPSIGTEQVTGGGIRPALSTVTIGPRMDALPVRLEIVGELLLCYLPQRLMRKQVNLLGMLGRNIAGWTGVDAPPEDAAQPTIDIRPACLSELDQLPHCQAAAGGGDVADYVNPQTVGALQVLD